MSDDKQIRELLYQAILELQYIQCVEIPGDHSQCATGKGREIIEQGMKLLGVKDLSREKLYERKSGE